MNYSVLIVSGYVSPGVARRPCCLFKATGQGQQRLVNSQGKEQGESQEEATWECVQAKRVRDLN